MKKNKIIILILFIFISTFSLIGCKILVNHFYQPILKSTAENEWMNFASKLKEVVKNYFSVEAEVTVDMFEDGCQKKQFPDDSCYDDLSDEEKKELYWDNDYKIEKYREWQNNLKQLPNLDNNFYKAEINKYLNEMRLWILYKHFWDRKKFERQFDEIFEISLLDIKNKRMIKTKESILNKLFDINWEYEIEKPDPKNPKKMIKEYNKKTQEKLFEFINYHEYIENEFDKVLAINIENYPKNIDKSRYFKHLTNYEKYINLNYYKEWKKIKKSIK